MRQIESVFKQMMERNADYDAQIASHTTSIRNVEVKIGQISQALNTHPKGALPSDTVVNLKGGNNTCHAMAATTRSGRGGDASTSNPKKIVSDDVVLQEDDEIQLNDDNMNNEVRIDVDDNMEETQNDVNPSREHVIDISETVVPKAKAPLPRPPPPYPQRLAKQNNENQFKKFIEMKKSLSINVPLVEALKQISGYAEFMKDLVNKKRSMNCETIKMTHQVSDIVHSMAPKLEDPSSFTISCTIGSADFAKTLYDLGASINLMPYSVFKTLGIGKPRANSMRLQMEDRTTKRPLTIGKALVDVEAGELTFRVGDEKVVFHMCKSMRQPNSNEVCSFLDLVMEVIVDDTSVVINVEDPLEAVLLIHEDDEKEVLVECENALQGMGSYSYGPINFPWTWKTRRFHQQSPQSRSHQHWS
ncbi:uncharacterized protein [Nicotiana tomentosiformis]|uniref:uncharacterized protein n=1 Tax=Nicotiana tomentosiformis TaxID=4098 RepID=UPI00388CAF50